MNQTTPNEHLAVACPRCGYDQRGVVGTWTENCPLNGTCAECGLEFAWAELLVPGKFQPLWCVEFSAGRWETVKACCKTALRSLWPWGFWKQLNMAHAVRWRRVLLYWAFLLAVVLVLYGVARTALGLRVYLDTQRACAEQSRQLLMRVPGMQADIAELESATPDMDQYERVKAKFGLTNEQDRLAVLQRTKALLNYTQQKQQAGQPTVFVQMPLWRAIYESVCTPGSTQSTGNVFGPGLMQPYPASAQLFRSLHSGMYYSWGSRLSTARELWKAAMVVTATLLVLIPIEFILLPISRRRAKVRWRHVWRVAAYSFVVPMACMAGIFVMASVMIAGGGGSATVLLPSVVIAALPVVLLPLWWAVAIGRYLKIPRGWLIAPVFAVLSLGALFVALLCSGLQ